MLIHVICFAFLIVMASTAIFTPVLLYVFRLKQLGWAWEHGALFSAMIASTDAVAVSAILKKGARLLTMRHSIRLKWKLMHACVHTHTRLPREWLSACKVLDSAHAGKGTNPVPGAASAEADSNFCTVHSACRGSGVHFAEG
jgi:hypothetical protein